MIRETSTNRFGYEITQASRGGSNEIEMLEEVEESKQNRGTKKDWHEKECVNMNAKRNNGKNKMNAKNVSERRSENDC